MTERQLDRRGFFKLMGSAAATAAIPTLPSIGSAAGDPPTRLIIFFTPNGTIKDNWRPNNTENLSIPNDGILAPLEPHKDKVLVVDGLDMESTNHGPGDGHQKGMGHMLTGTELQPGGQFQGGGNSGTVGWADNMSVDQFIANKTHNKEPFKSIEFGVQSGGPNVWSRMIYSGPAQPVEPVQDPFKAFDRLFGSVIKDKRQREKAKARRKSVLDFVQKDLQSLESKVSSADRKRLRQHLTSVRDIEKRLMTGNANGVACKEPNTGQRFNPQDNKNFPQTGRLMLDMIVSAFSCGLTRVASIQWDRSVGQVLPSWLGISDRHHDMSHEDDKYKSELTKLNRWYAEQFKYLLDKLDSVKEGNGTMLDNTAVLWCNELGDGSRHSRSDMPFVLAGGGGGHFKTGKFLQIDRNHNDLLVSLCNSMGLQETSFGNPAYCNGPLREIEA